MRPKGKLSQQKKIFRQIHADFYRKWFSHSNKHKWNSLDFELKKKLISDWTNRCGFFQQLPDLPSKTVQQNPRVCYDKAKIRVSINCLRHAKRKLTLTRCARVTMSQVEMDTGPKFSSAAWRVGKWTAALQMRNRQKLVLQSFKFRHAHVKIYSRLISADIC